MSVPSPQPRAEEPRIRDVIEEFGRILDLLRAQLEDSVAEAGRECAALGECFGHLVSANEAIERVADGERRAEVLGRCAEIRSNIDSVVVGLQYQDRLSQRLGHIRTGLDRLQVALRDGNDRSPSDWLRLLGEVEQTQQQEQSRLACANAGPRGSVELF
jgi:hypothetical protein